MSLVLVHALLKAGVISVLFLALTHIASGQEAAVELKAKGGTNTVETANITPPATDDPADEPALSISTNAIRIVRPHRAEFRGILPAVRKTRNPLQLINPLAPLQLGDGYQNVSLNPRTRRMEGVSIFSVRF